MLASELAAKNSAFLVRCVTRIGGREKGVRIARIGTVNQRDIKPSHPILDAFGRSLNQRVQDKRTA